MDKHRTPLVSVIIPTYNRRALVQEAIDSVLAQTFTDYELIVIDDGSTDGTGEQLARYGDGLTYVWRENQGESAARNHGITLSRGRYIAFLDSDDLWLPEKLARQVPVLERSPDVGLVYCWTQRIDEKGRRINGQPLGFKSAERPLVFAELYEHGLGSVSGVVMRRTVLDTLGGFDATIKYGEDGDLWLRGILVTRFAEVPEILVYTRVHPGNQGRLRDADQVTRRLGDHLRLLERMDNLWPDKSDDAADLLRLRMAAEYCKAAMNSFALALPDLAQRQLAEAIALAPTEWEAESSLILTGAAMQFCAPPHALMAPEAYIDVVLSHLPPSQEPLRAQRHRLLAMVRLGLRALERYRHAHGMPSA
jgi:glycosyltransferase involved in cell wall biosynthesis